MSEYTDCPLEPNPVPPKMYLSKAKMMFPATGLDNVTFQLYALVPSCVWFLLIGRHCQALVVVSIDGSVAARAMLDSDNNVIVSIAVEFHSASELRLLDDPPIT